MILSTHRGEGHKLTLLQGPPLTAGWNIHLVPHFWLLPIWAPAPSRLPAALWAGKKALPETMWHRRHCTTQSKAMSRFSFGANQLETGVLLTYNSVHGDCARTLGKHGSTRSRDPLNTCECDRRVDTGFPLQRKRTCVNVGSCLYALVVGTIFQSTAWSNQQWLLRVSQAQDFHTTFQPQTFELEEIEPGIRCLQTIDSF